MLLRSRPLLRAIVICLFCWPARGGPSEIHSDEIAKEPRILSITHDDVVHRRESSDKRFYKLGSGLKVEYKASSTWQNGNFGHEPHDAVQTRESYWSSGHKATEPVYWWMSFGEEQVEIVAVDFFLFHPGGKYEFFATTDKEKCFSKKDADDDRRFFFEHSFSEYFGNTRFFKRQFVNGQKYHCYGLKITNILTYATVESFRFYVPSDCNPVPSHWRGALDYVCGSDGKTYRNERVLEHEQCVAREAGKTLTQVSKGYCTTADCKRKSSWQDEKCVYGFAFGCHSNSCWRQRYRGSKRWDYVYVRRGESDGNGRRKPIKVKCNSGKSATEIAQLCAAAAGGSACTDDVCFPLNYDLGENFINWEH